MGIGREIARVLAGEGVSTVVIAGSCPPGGRWCSPTRPRSGSLPGPASSSASRSRRGGPPVSSSASSASACCSTRSPSTGRTATSSSVTLRSSPPPCSWAASILQIRALRWRSTPFDLVPWEALLATLILAPMALAATPLPHVAPGAKKRSRSEGGRVYPDFRQATNHAMSVSLVR